MDVHSEVITAAEVTPGDVNEAHLLIPLTEVHHQNTSCSARVVVADSKYGTIENFLACHDRGMRAHIPDLGQVATERVATHQRFSEAAFEYDPQTDTYRCPAGKRLHRKSLHLARQSIDYAAPKAVCAACTIREQCTQNRAGRTVKRHLRQEALNQMRAISRSSQARRDQRIRQHLMERSFARSTRYGFDRARWRGLWRVRIQEYLVCTIQNIQVLLKYGRDPKKRLAMAARQIEKGWGWVSYSMNGALLSVNKRTQIGPNMAVPQVA